MTLQLWLLGLPYGGPFNGRDSHGTFFSVRTDFWLDKLPLPVVLRYHGLNEGRPQLIGRTVRYERRADGVWFLVELKETPENRDIVREAAAGMVRASSGAISHLVRPLQQIGEMLIWPIVDLSIIRLALGERPSNPYAVAMAQVRSTYRAIQEDYPMWVWDAQRQQYVWIGEGTPTSYPPAQVPAANYQPPAPQPYPVQQGQVYQPPMQQPAPAQPPAPQPPAPQAPQQQGQQMVQAPTIEQLEQQVAAYRAAQLTPRAPMPNPNLIQERGEPELWANGTPFVDAVRALRRGRFESVFFDLSVPIPQDADLPAETIRAMSEGTASAGGYIVPTLYSNKVIELLRAKTAVRAAGAVVWPVVNDDLRLPRQSGGSTAYWVAENSQITASDLVLEEVTLAPKKLTALTKMSSELFTDSDPQVEALVMADIAAVLSLEEDLKFLRGTGASNTPTGLDNISGVTVDAGTTTFGANGGTPTFDILVNMIYNSLDLSNIPADGRAWICHPRLINTLRKIKDSQNHYLWADPAAPGDPPTVWGYPLYTTTQIPINVTLGASTDTTSIYLGRWPDFAIGQRKMLELKASDSAGNAFEYDQVFIRGIERLDCNVRHPLSFSILRGCRP